MWDFEKWLGYVIVFLLGLCAGGGIEKAIEEAPPCPEPEKCVCPECPEQPKLEVIPGLGPDLTKDFDWCKDEYLQMRSYITLSEIWDKHPELAEMLMYARRFIFSDSNLSLEDQVYEMCWRQEREQM